jgi:hypothetical protein
MVCNTSFTSASSILKKCILIPIFLMLVACGATNQVKSVENLSATKEGAKILLMPLDVELSVLTAAGLTEPNAEWTENAIVYMKNSVASNLAEKNVNLIDYSNNSNDPASVPVQLEKLHEAVGRTILQAGFLPLPSRSPDETWTLGRDANVLSQQTGADYALFVFVRDSYASGGRVAMSVLMALAGVGVSGGSQFGFASLVDLKTGDVVWFNRLMRGTGDMREPEPAAETAKVLLTGFPSAN